MGKRYRHKDIKDVVYVVLAVAASGDLQFEESGTKRAFWVSAKDVKKYYRVFK